MKHEIEAFPEVIPHKQMDEYSVLSTQCSVLSTAPRSVAIGDNELREDEDVRRRIDNPLGRISDLYKHFYYIGFQAILIRNGPGRLLMML